MAGDELFKRYLEIGASVLGMSRERAESIVRDLVASGEVAKGQAAKVADWLVDRGRSGSEEVAELVRREIRQQVTALGLATKDDVAELRAQIEALGAGAPAPAGRKPASPKKTAPAAKAAPAKRPAAPTAGKSAGITRSASVRKRPGAPTGSVKPGGAPASGADPAKG